MKSFGLGALALTVALISGPALADADLAKGKKLYNKCKACHSLEAGENKIGPSLAGLFDREAGSVEDFKYSEAMKTSGITWNEETLDAYLTNPKDFVAGNKMVFPGIKKESQRVDLIAYLKEATQ